MLIFLHVLAALIGIGSSSARTAFFFKKGTLHPLLQKTVWFSLLILGVTGFGLLFAKPILLHSPAFWIKMFFVGTLFVGEFYLAKKQTAWAGFVSLFSWYFSFFWSGLERLQVGYLGILGFYFVVVLFSFLAARRYGYT